MNYCPPSIAKNGSRMGDFNSGASINASNSAAAERLPISEHTTPNGQQNDAPIRGANTATHYDQMAGSPKGSADQLPVIPSWNGPIGGTSGAV